MLPPHSSCWKNAKQPKVDKMGGKTCDHRCPMLFRDIGVQWRSEVKGREPGKNRMDWQQHCHHQYPIPLPCLNQPSHWSTSTCMS